MPFKALCALLALLATCTASLAQEIGVVKHVSGVVELSRDGAVSMPRVGDALMRQDTVRTGDDGAFGATLDDGTAIGIGRESAIEFAAFTFEPAESLFDLVIRALSGRVIVETGLIGEEAPERVRVETPRLVVGVRGTRFAVVVEDNP
jgi:hypothetical protein